MTSLSPHLRNKKVAQVLWLTLGLNLVVCLFKLIYGYKTQTLSMAADGYHSLMDSSSNVVGLMALAISAFQAKRHLAKNPGSLKHSHHKAEAFASIFISLLLFLSCYEIASNAYGRFFHPIVPEVNFWSFLIMVGTMLVNFWVSHYEHHQGEKLDSQILTSDAAHTRSDIFVSISVIIALIGIELQWSWMDLGAAVIISGLIGYSGYKIVLESLEVLWGEKLKH